MINKAIITASTLLLGIASASTAQVTEQEAEFAYEQYNVVAEMIYGTWRDYPASASKDLATAQISVLHQNYEAYTELDRFWGALVWSAYEGQINFFDLCLMTIATMNER